LLYHQYSTEILYISRSTNNNFIASEKFMDVLVSGKTSFKVEVPYKLIETGQKREKPLIVYLHGRGQNLEIFERLTKPLLELEAYHLFIQGPYADTELTQTKERWQYMWYLYNGRQGSFLKSLEYTAEFIQEIIDHVIQFIKVSRLCLLGYSMGGYQAGYFGITRWKHTNEMILIGARYKTEILTASKWSRLRHQNVLAIHGKKDSVVDPTSQQKEIENFLSRGINASFIPVSGGHKLSLAALDEASRWLVSLGYTKV
jgi:predicted esterase